MSYFINPSNGIKLYKKGNDLCQETNDEVIAKIVNGIPRFIEVNEHYAQNFGYQWNKWENLLSDQRNTGDHKINLILSRTHFGELEMEGKTILECGCGGGDDTEVLLKLPFKEVHSFDLSSAIDRANKYLDSGQRLHLSQASITKIPYPDDSFDFVFCHRVLQHTPRPEESLMSIMKKVKSGGILFVHSYHKSFNYMQNYKYKYRFITKRLPIKWIVAYLDNFAKPLHHLNKLLYKTKITKQLAYNFIPMQYISSYADFDTDKLIELEKLVTFDALTPAYDRPMTWAKMRNMVEGAGFEILFKNPNPKGSPIYLTARKK